MKFRIIKAGDKYEIQQLSHEPLAMAFKVWLNISVDPFSTPEEAEDYIRKKYKREETNVIKEIEI